MFYDGQAQTGSLIGRTARHLFLREHIKSVCGKFFTHADALIPADKGDKCVLLIQLFFAAPNGDRTPWRTELDGIVRNVGEDPAEVHRVSDYERMPDRVLIPCNLIPNVFFCRLFMIRLVQVAQHGNQVKGQFLLLDLAALELVHIQHVIDNAYQISQRFHLLIADFLLHFGVVGILVAHVDHTDNTVQRSADVMAHGGKEPRFHFGFTLGRFCGKAQVLLAAFCAADTAHRAQHMGHIAGLIPFLCNEAQGMPASVAHAVFCGDIFFVFQSFRKGGHIHETADQVAVFGHHSGIAELIQLLRGTAVVSGQAVRLIIVGDFLKIVALQINAVDGAIVLGDGGNDLIVQLGLIQRPLQLGPGCFFLFQNIINVAEGEQDMEYILFGIDLDCLRLKILLPAGIRNTLVMIGCPVRLCEKFFHIGAGEPAYELGSILFRQKTLCIPMGILIKICIGLPLLVQYNIRVGVFGQLQRNKSAGIQLNIIHNRKIYAQLIQQLFVALFFFQGVLQFFVLHTHPQGKRSQQNKQHQQSHGNNQRSHWVQLNQHFQRHIRYAVRCVAGGNILDGFVRHCVDRLGEYARQRMADRRGDDNAVLEGGLIQQRIDKTAACVIAHKFLRHVIVHKCGIGPAVFDGLYGILPGRTENLLGIGRIGVLHTAGRALIRRGHRLNLPVKIAADNFGRSYRDIRRSDPQMIGFCCALVDACINGNIEALILLQGEILLAGTAGNELIGKTGILCQLFKIIRQDALYLTVFHKGVRLSCGVAQHTERLTLGIIPTDKSLLVLGQFRIFIIDGSIVAVEQRCFPVALGGVHFVYGGVDFGK